MTNSNANYNANNKGMIGGTWCRYQREDILSKGIVSEEDYLVLEKYTRALFQRGLKLLQVVIDIIDTKYEFGKTKDGLIVLIDEIYTWFFLPFYLEGYQERQTKEKNKNNYQRNLYVVGWFKTAFKV
jgi:phosphoribosylaminoimidazole-succinocarboxamide synthase